MFNYNRDSPQRQLLENDGFPLQKLDPPMRTSIFRNMRMGQLIKMSLESVVAARDIKLENVIPKTMNIVVGDFKNRKVQFLIDGFSCTVGTRSAMKDYESYTWFPVKTISGVEIPNCAMGNRQLFLIVPDEGELLWAVKAFYSHICSVFGEPLHYNFSVFGELAYIAAEILKIRNITSVDTLKLRNNWNLCPEQTVIFDMIMSGIQYINLKIDGVQPLGSAPVTINADSVKLSIENQDWLTEERLIRIDAKRIELFWCYDQLGWGLQPIFDKRFNYVLRNWAAGTGFGKLELLNLKRFDGQINNVLENLTTLSWDRNKHPGYYWDYTLTPTGEKQMRRFYDLKNAKDLKNPQDKLGTIVHDYWNLKFVVWSSKEFATLEGEAVEITQRRDWHSEKAEQFHRQYEAHLGAYLEAQQRLERWDIGEEHQVWREQVADLELQLLEEDQEDMQETIRDKLRELREPQRAAEREVRIEQSHTESARFNKGANDLEVSKYNGWLDIIARDRFPWRNESEKQSK